MTVIRNQRDKLLQAASIREFDSRFAQIVLTPSATIFNKTAAGVDPEFITFTADLYGLTGLVDFSIVGGTMTREGNVATVRGEDVPGALVQVTASLQSNGRLHSETRSINKISADIQTIKDELLGNLTEDYLTDELRGRIDLVDGGPDVVGSVSSRLKAETDARIAQLDEAITAATAARDAFVKSYTYSKVEADQAEALQTFNVTTAYTTYVDGQSGITLNAAKSYVQGYSYSKTSSDESLSAMATTLRSEMAGSAGVSAAYVENYAYSKSQTNEAIATQTQTLSSTVNGHTTSIQTNATSINGLKGQYTVKIDNNGYVTGYGLASSYVNGVPTSAFTVLADAFKVVVPGYAPKVMFSVDGNGVGFSGPLIGPSGTLGQLTIASGGHIKKGMSDYAQGVGFFIGEHWGLDKFALGNPNGAMIWWDGYTLQTQGIGINSAVYPAFTVSITNATQFYDGYNGNKTLISNTMGLNIVGNGNTASISWTLAVYSASSGGIALMDSATGSTMRLRSQVGMTPGANFCLLRVTLIGHDGRTASDELAIDFQHN